jgi:ribosomal protein L4
MLKILLIVRLSKEKELNKLFNINKNTTEVVNDILEDAKDQLQDVIIIGSNREGGLYLDANNISNTTILGMIELAKHIIIHETFD